MSHEVIVEFVDFEVGAHARVYNFTVREPFSEARNFTLTISNSAFANRLISFQDAPDVCSRKLRGELAAHGNTPAETCLNITVADLEKFRRDHSSENTPIVFPRKPSEDF